MKKSYGKTAVLVVIALTMIMAAQTVPAAEYTVTRSVDYTGP